MTRLTPGSTPFLLDAVRDCRISGEDAERVARLLALLEEGRWDGLWIEERHDTIEGRRYLCRLDESLFVIVQWYIGDDGQEWLHLANVYRDDMDLDDPFSLP